MDTKKNDTVNKNHGGDCSHPSLAKEFVLGLPTGNFVCAHCGRPLSSILRADRR